MVSAMTDVDTAATRPAVAAIRKLTIIAGIPSQLAVLEQLTKPIPLTASELKNVETSGLPPRMDRPRLRCRLRAILRSRLSYSRQHLFSLARD